MTPAHTITQSASRTVTSLPILHWNDVYRVTPQKVSPGSTETIDVTRFASFLDNIRSQWTTRSDGARDGLSLFSGDLFSPSMESTVTRGSHMVPIINELAPDIALTGNHDFDFGYPHLTKLVQDTRFPWLLSNIIDEDTGRVPEHLQQFQVVERVGLRVGIIGLVEEDWITTVPSWPRNFKFRGMAETGLELSEILRKPDGEYQCDLVIALTHSRLPNDIQLAKDLFASSPSAQCTPPNFLSHGVDIILGGHDHIYFASKGVSSWEGYDTESPTIGAENDHGDVLVVKSGTDFRDLSQLMLELEDAPEGSVRRKVIKAVHGKRHTTTSDIPSSKSLQKIVSSVLSSVSETLKAPVCVTEVELDLRSQLLRTNETAAANWFADVLRHAYDDTLYTKAGSGSDGVLICAGTLRGDSVYPAGEITLGNILETLPFEDPVVVIELDGEGLWDALEAALSKFPAQEGRFPVISGFRVTWDSRLSPGQRVLGIWMLQETPGFGNNGTEGPTLIDGEEVKREKTGRTYKIVTRQYMVEGHDGFMPLVGRKYLVDDENGQLMSALVRKYLLGRRFVNSMTRLSHQTMGLNLLHDDTPSIIAREVDHQKRHAGGRKTKTTDRWQSAMAAVRCLIPKTHYLDHINVSAREHMSGVDCFDGGTVRRGRGAAVQVGSSDFHQDLPVIHPAVDGRLKDEGRIEA
ncbi:Metallo-dependent phosphatase-like protein [Pisolithus croceorrhizus]|nr:Metallo-dependent phosphatase-like protein [Pisolithus croceorrhizus]